MKFFIRIFSISALLSTLFYSGLISAQEQPVELVQNAISKLQQQTHNKNAEFKKNPGVLHDLLAQTLDPIADFPYIAASVMGKYYQGATPAQRAQFASVFQQSALDTITQGLLSFNYEALKLSELQQAQRIPDVASVQLEVTGSDQKVYPISFTLRFRNNEWKVINVIANGINLGLTFRNQFEQSMTKHQRNIDQVIKSWESSNAVEQLKQSSSHG